MGFQRGRIILEWPEGHDLHGLEVVMRRRPLGEVMDAWATADELESIPWDDRTKEQHIELNRRNVAELAGMLVSWNFEDQRGRPVVLPEALERRVEVLLRHCDAPMITDMRTAYNTALIRVAPPLPPSSAPGPEATEPEEESWDMAGLQEVLPAG
jgi:hypothetical protein